MAGTSIPRFFVKFMMPVFISRSACRRRNETGGLRDPVLRSRAESGINLFLMKRLLLFFIVSAAFPYALFASDSLPFPVSLGGQAAKDGTPFAKIENPVAANAELAVESKGDMMIVNVKRVTAKHEPAAASTRAVTAR